MRSRPATAEVRPPSFETLQQLVAQFSAHGGRTAIVSFRNDAVDELSYAQLADAVVRTARSLHTRGIGAGDRVALWAPNSTDWIIAYFGIVCAGAAAVPLDQQSTAETVVAALAHATPRLLITTLAHRRELERHGAPMLASLLIDGSDAESLATLRAEDVVTELPRMTSAAIASLLFTSGTTGTPKAVPLTHANLASNTCELAAAGVIGVNERVLLPLPLHHTYPFTVGLLAPLAIGAAIILPTGLSGPEISHASAAGRATALLAVPRLCTALWDSVLAGANARGAVAAFAFRTLLALSGAVRRATGLRVGRWLFRAVHARLGGALEIIGCGGAKLATDLAQNLEGLGWTVLTGYGLTETSPVLTFNSRRHSRLGTEGRALRGVELRIADAASDTPGEILARGPSVFKGYWNAPAATAATFTADGWFKTGDLGRLDEGGYLHVVGRSKELIVLADGKKFFPETVEKLYAESAAVLEIGVFERGGRLAAVAVPNEDAARASGTLREAAWLRERLDDVASRLAPYQRITSYRFVRTPLPRTQLGKLRRHLLPALFDGTAQDKTGDTAPWSATDRQLVDSPLGGSVWRWLVERYPDHTLTLDTSPQLDLEIDSLEWVALTVEIEQRFRVALRSDQLGRILTLRDFLHEIESAPRAGASIAPAQPAFVPPGPVARALGGGVFAAVRIAVRATLRLRVHGLEHLPTGPALITPNHTSYLDPLVLAAALPWRRLRRTYWAGWVGVMHSSRLRRWLSHATQVFPVDPDRDLTAALRTARTLLDQGHTVVWFPEGRRSATGELGQFQAGVGALLAETTTPAVPTAIVGTYAAWPKHRRWPRAAPTSVTFGAPLTFAAGETAGEVRATLERAVAALLTPDPRSPTPLNAVEHRRGEPAMSSTNTTTATLRDGRRITIRAIRHDDVAGNAAFLDGLSAQSKHSLFLGGIGQLSDAALQRLCDPDHAHDMAYVALTEDAAAPGHQKQVGVCRYAGGAEAGAEISVAVADDWQHQGLGKLLLRQLIAHASAHGVRRLFSMDAIDNEPMRRLARDLGFRESPDPDDIHQVIYSLQPQQS